MPTKEVTLAVAAFADSPQARALDVPAADARDIVERLLRVCYGELGKQPRLLDGDDVRVGLGELLPGHFKAKDPLISKAPAVLEAYFAHLVEAEVVTQSFEIQQALPAALASMEAAVMSGAAPQRAPQADKPFVHGAQKLGRNDPCSCGSGKKFKKCHGRSGDAR